MVAKAQAKHDLDKEDIDEADELGEISGDEQLQYCLVRCLTHKKYEWHWIWRSIGAAARRKQKARKARRTGEKGTSR